MKRKTIVIQAVLLGFLLSVFLLPSAGNAEVNVSVSVPLPPLVIPAPPGLVVIPGRYVYYPPDVQTDIFFYHGSWYRPHGGRWYRAAEYNGPWRDIAINRVPRAVIGVPPGFRRGPVVHERVHYRDVKTNWRTWERDRHWDRDRHERREDRRDERREHEGRGHDHERGMR
jgi:hypothetical protein